MEALDGLTCSTGNECLILNGYFAYTEGLIFYAPVSKAYCFTVVCLSART